MRSKQTKSSKSSSRNRSGSPKRSSPKRTAGSPRKQSPRKQSSHKKQQTVMDVDDGMSVQTKVTTASDFLERAPLGDYE